jgi:hypothetical protein
MGRGRFMSMKMQMRVPLCMGVRRVGAVVGIG